MAQGKKKKQSSAGIDFISAAKKAQFPPPVRDEVVFAGRSNVGKSTLVNALSRRKALARTSKTPGKTQLVFFYESWPDATLVDLPGYGYAKSSRSDIETFSRVTDDYLHADRPIAVVLILVDIRRGFGDLDLQMVHYVCHFGLPWQVVLTKADKLSRHAQIEAERDANEVIEAFNAAYRTDALPALSVAAGTAPNDRAMDQLKERIRLFLA